MSQCQVSALDAGTFFRNKLLGKTKNYLFSPLILHIILHIQKYTYYFQEVKDIVLLHAPVFRLYHGNSLNNILVQSKVPSIETEGSPNKCNGKRY